MLEKLRLVSRYLQVPLATQADFEPEDSPPVPSIWHPALLPAPPNILGAFPPFSSAAGVHIYAAEKGVHHGSSPRPAAGHPPPRAGGNVPRAPEGLDAVQKLAKVLHVVIVMLRSWDHAPLTLLGMGNATFSSLPLL